MEPVFQCGGYYVPERDGPLQEYLKTHNGRSAFPLFKGYEMYETLRDEGYLAQHYSIVRLMWNIGRDDEHFLVVDDFQLEGMVAAAHSGRDGVHDPKDILTDDGPPWEAFQLNPKKLYEKLENEQEPEID
ncbi:MAG: hypothetical protein ABIE94_06610 [archaeon]